MFNYHGDIAYEWVNANNLTESWYSTMKTYYFKDKILQQLDHVIYVLVNNAISHYQTHHNLYFIEVGWKTKGTLNK